MHFAIGLAYWGFINNDGTISNQYLDNDYIFLGRMIESNCWLYNIFTSRAMALISRGAVYVDPFNDEHING